MKIPSLRKLILSTYRLFFANKASRRLNELVLDCAYRGLGVLNYENSRISGEDYFLGSILPTLLGRDLAGEALLDVGANIGHYTTTLLSRFPSARIISIEPNPISYKVLCNISAGRSMCLNVAVANADSTGLLYDRSDVKGSEHASLNPDVISVLHKQESIAYEVKIRKLDSIASEYGLGRIGLLKIDTEGFELDVLKGAASILKEKRVSVIHLEFNEMNVLTKTFMRDIVALLPGYVPYRLLPRALIPLPTRFALSEVFAFQNIAFIKADLVARLP